MKDEVWKMAKWNLSWEEMRAGKNNAQGVCQFSGETGAVLDIPFGDISQTITLEETGSYAASLEPPRYDYLFGQTQDGLNVVLGDVQSMGVERTFPGNSRERLSAGVVYCSHHEFDPAALIDSADLEIEGLREWVGICPSQEIDHVAALIECQDTSDSLLLYQSGRCSIELQYGIERIKRNANGIYMPCFARIHISFGDAVALDGLWSHELSRARSFLAFCFGFFPDINDLCIYLRGDVRPVNVYLASFLGEKKNVNHRNVPIPFSIARDYLPEMFDCWMKMEGDEVQASNMLTSLLGHWDMPFDMLLFAATSMFESLARVNSEDLYDRETLESYVEPMLAAADNSIRDRARGLLSLLSRPSYGMLLDHAYEESGRWGKELIPDWKRFRKEQIKLRNEGAHALSDEREYEMMTDHYYAQIVLAYVIEMKRLNAPDAIWEAYESSSFMTVARRTLKENYSLHV